MSYHDEVTYDANHISHAYEYANAAARTGASGFVAADVGKIARQTDDDSFYVLTATTPTWLQIGSGTLSGPGSSTDNAVARWDGAGGDTLQDSEVTISDIGVITSIVEDAVTNAITSLLILSHNSSGTPADGLGTGIEMQAETSTTVNSRLGQLTMDWMDITHSSRESQFKVLLDRNGVLNENAVVTHVNFAVGAAVGNARGDGVFDFQGYRSGADRVVTGQLSGVFAGADGKNAGVNAVIIGGDYNEITADGWTSVILGGTAGYADKRSQIVSAGGQFAAQGDAQGSIQICVRRSVTHSDANWYELFTNGTTQRLTIRTDSAWAFDILLVGATSGMGKTFGFRIDGVIENDGGTTTLLASNVTTLYDTDDVSFDARVSADDTNDALLIEVSDSDGAGDTVRWSGTIRTAEILYA